MSIAESIIAIFILVTGFVVMARLFHTGLRYQSMVEAQQVAVVLAEAKMEEIRGWNNLTHKVGGSVPFSDWTTCPGSSTPTPDLYFPDYLVSVNTTLAGLYDPCSHWETQYAPVDRRCMQRSCMRVRVTVSWGNRSLPLESLVGAPGVEVGTLANITITPDAGTPTTIGHGSRKQFTAIAMGPSSDVLDDVLFEWYIYGVGCGTMQQYRDGSAANLTNYMQDAATPPAITGYGDGDCYMRAVGRVRGLEVFGDSGNVTLAP